MADVLSYATIKPAVNQARIQGSLRRGEFKMMKQLQAQMSEELQQRLGKRRSVIRGIGDDDDD